MSNREGSFSMSSSEGENQMVLPSLTSDSSAFFFLVTNLSSSPFFISGLLCRWL